jgi:hypothetical protein
VPDESDNCPNDHNPTQQNSDGDPQGNACDSDDDNDDLSDIDEAIYGTNPLWPDTDNDSLSDGLEVSIGTDPLVLDSDGDSFWDSEELDSGSDPLSGSNKPEHRFFSASCSDGLDNDLDATIDGSDPGCVTILELDLDITNGAGPCSIVDTNRSVNVGSSFDVAVCATLPAPIAAFNFRLIYDDTVILAPEVADEGAGVDDNPDANLGTTTFTSPALGSPNWDCHRGVSAYPKGDDDPATGPGHGRAYVTCGDVLGPWPLSSGVLAMVRFDATGAGETSLSFANVELTAGNVYQIGSCSPVLDSEATCVAATVNVPCVAPSPTCSSGFWSGSLDETSLGACAFSVVQQGGSNPSVTGSATCTVAGAGSFIGSFNTSNRRLTGSIGFELPNFQLTLDGTISTSGQIMLGNWSCECGNGSFSLARVESETAALVTSSAGGTLLTASGDALNVPAGALAADTLLTSLVQPAQAEPPHGLAAIARAYDFGPDGTIFNTPVTAVFNYTDDDLAGGLVDPATLRVYVYDSLAQQWQLLGGTVDTLAKTITVQITHFSDFAIFGNMPAAIDADGDAVSNAADNCVNTPNQDQLNADGAWLSNGPLVPGDDITWPMSDAAGNACDSDDDNDGLADAVELVHPVTGCSSATASLNPLDMDTDGDHLTDGWECANGSDPTNPASKSLGPPSSDNDGDHIPDPWETRGYGASAASTDSDGDGCADLVEVASIDGNKAVGDPDRLAVARRALNIWPPQPNQDHVLDISKNGTIGDEDRLFVARAALLPDWLPKSCP